MNASAEIDLIIASKDDWRGAKLAQLRANIMDAVPELEESVKWKMPSKPLGSPVWMLSGKNLIVADYLKNAVRLTFEGGQLLPDPGSLFNARLDSKVCRAIDFTESMYASSSQLTELVRAAASQLLA
jgi:hypothetical protein